MFPISSAKDGWVKITCSNDEQSPNEYSFIFVTEDGIVIDVNEEQSMFLKNISQAKYKIIINKTVSLTNDKYLK